MGAETLQTELLGVPGVSAAEIDAGAGAIPAGVKVSLSPDADARRVGIEVQRTFAPSRRAWILTRYPTKRIIMAGR